MLAALDNQVAWARRWLPCLPGFCGGVADLNSGLHTCTDALQAEPSPRPVPVSSLFMLEDYIIPKNQIIHSLGSVVLSFQG